MSLTNAQYDEIMHEYNKRQFQTSDEMDRRKAEVILKAPAYKACLDEISSISISAAKAKIMGQSEELTRLNQSIANLQFRMEEAMTNAGFPADYLKPIYICKDCKDTGYIGNEKCHCFKQAEINLLYRQSNLKNILDRENFENFDINVYSDSASRHKAEIACAKCKDFVANFPSGQNIFFTGTTGVGKTFLSNCIAKEVLDSYHSVLYLSAIDLFEYFSSKTKSSEYSGLDNSLDSMQIIECELLIIDDLGTELFNSFTNSKIFYCINERILHNRSTIISTNLNLVEFQNTYSERIFSRISDSYTIIQLSGDDIRMNKR